jgi:hypothetical protein
MTNENQFETERLVDGWIRYSGSTRLNPAIEPDYWAWEALDKLCSRSPEVAWTVILRILNSTDHEFVLENLAAGPLETLLARHGRKFIGLIEERAEADLRFRWLLAGIWKNSIPDDLWSRLQAAVNEVPEILPALPKFNNP